MPRLFFDLFKKSPFKPLHEHMRKVRESIELLPQLFEAYLKDKDMKRVKEIVKKISKLEHKADIIKNDIRQSLPGGIFLPVNREDLLGYLKEQDDIADAVEDVSVLLTLKDLTVSESLHDDIFELIDKVMQVCILCDLAEDEFENLLESAFGEPEKQKMMDLVAKAEHAEWEADKAEAKAAKRLLALEGEMTPVDIFMMFRVFGALGSVANHAEKTGDRLRRLLIKN